MVNQPQMIKRQQALADFGEYALRSENLDEVLGEACRLVAEALETPRSKILEIVEDGETLLLRAGVGWRPEIIGQLQLSMSEATSESYSIRSCKPVISQDIRSEDRFVIPEFMKDAGVVALANTPILLPGGRAYGLLQVEATVPRLFSEDDTQFLRTYATILGPVIDRLHKLHTLHASDERFRLIVEATRDYAIFTMDAQGRIDGWFPGAETVFGWSAEEMLGQPSSITFTPEDRLARQDEIEIRTARRDGRAPNVRWHLRKDGRRVFIEGVTRALRDGSGAVEGFVKIGQDVTQRREVDAQLRDSEARQRALIEGVPQLVWRAVDGGKWTWASPQWTAYTGLSHEESCGRGWLAAYHPDDHEAVRTAWASAEFSRPIDIEARIFHAVEQRYRWFQTRATPVRDTRGRIAEWLGTSTDVDDLRQMQERQGVLVGELQHRTRNLIAVVRAIAGQTMRTSDDLEDFQRAFDDRLGALSRVQGLLSRSDEEPITIGALIGVELDALGATAMPDRIRAEGPDAVLRNATVQTLALAIHELATNARKYGAFATDTGRLSVVWTVRAEAGHRLRIEWTEEGLDPEAEAGGSATRPGGYGRELIERALPYALGARTSYELVGTSLHCVIDLPLDKPGTHG